MVTKKQFQGLVDAIGFVEACRITKPVEGMEGIDERLRQFEQAKDRLAQYLRVNDITVTE